jgi:ATP-dependent DNA ligase
VGTERWELAIHNGQFKGRYAFVDASGAMSSGNNEGRLIARMKDRGVRLEKPDYKLKDRAWLTTHVAAQPERYTLERKYDGALVNAAGREGRMYLRSHREGGETYYDHFPQLEHLDNDSRLLTCRVLFPKADFDFTVQAELVHADGAARVGGLCNSAPEKAQTYQETHGPASLFVWDCLNYCGKDISGRPYRERRVYATRLVEELRPYSDHIHLAEEMPTGMDPVVFYDRVVSDHRGLPYSEGVVVKDNRDPSGGAWYKVKQSDLADYELVRVIPGGSGKFATSA